MKPAIIQLPDIYRGCLYPGIIFRWKDRQGEPFDLTGWIPLCFAKDFDFLVRVSDEQHGETRIRINKEATATFKLGTQHWDFIWLTGATVYPPVLSGTVTVREPLSDTTPDPFEPFEE